MISHMQVDNKLRAILFSTLSCGELPGQWDRLSYRIESSRFKATFSSALGAYFSLHIHTNRERIIDLFGVSWFWQNHIAPRTWLIGSHNKPLCCYWLKSAPSYIGKKKN